MNGSPKSALPDDVATLQALVIQQREAIVQQCEVIAALSTTVGEQAAEKERLLHRLALALRQRHGQRRERFHPDQALLFEQADLEALETESNSSAAETPVVVEIESEAETNGESSIPATKPKKKGHGRRELPAHLPRQVIRYELPVAQRACPCCAGVKWTPFFGPRGGRP